MTLAELFPTHTGLAEFCASAGFFSDTRVSRLSGGLSNNNYLLAETRVLRVNRNLDGLGSGRVNEIKAWETAAGKELAPALYDVSKGYEYYLSQYLRDGCPDKQGMQQISSKQLSSALLESCGDRFKEQSISSHMHALLELMLGLGRLPLPEYRIDASKQWHTYQQALLDVRRSATAPLCRAIDTLLVRQVQVSDWITSMESAQTGLEIFCHRDLNPLNLLRADDRLMAIDFEYACQSGPLNELATVLATHKLNHDEVCWLCHHYLNGIGLVDWKPQQVLASVNTYWVFSCCWALLQSAAQGDSTLPWFEEFYQLLPNIGSPV
ncbi:phosphotransferase [Shewanella submarina]|uniref:Phosphotransferase n=1 Tax=Shewanella submarina TaxID=2016376 RepID=A0ABV7G9W3_9GAMM|nr:phosphotransferase [Shewanella submarina]MCL1039709.1 phosphotransferase [Shewanella submarina]